MIRILTIALLSIVVTACAHVSQPYTPSAANIEDIKQLTSGSTIKMSVGNFTADKDVQASIMCRGEGPVSAPGGKTFEQYIKDAIVQELTIARIFDQSSDRKLTAVLNQIDFSSAMSGGRWDIMMTFSAKEVEPFVIRITYPFDSSFVAYTACNEVAQALPLATQKLINELIKHPSFLKIIGATN